MRKSIYTNTLIIKEHLYDDGTEAHLEISNNTEKKLLVYSKAIKPKRKNTLVYLVAAGTESFFSRY